MLIGLPVCYCIMFILLNTSRVSCLWKKKNGNNGVTSIWIVKDLRTSVLFIHRVSFCFFTDNVWAVSLVAIAEVQNGTDVQIGQILRSFNCMCNLGYCGVYISQTRVIFNGMNTTKNLYLYIKSTVLRIIPFIKRTSLLLLILDFHSGSAVDNLHSAPRIHPANSSRNHLLSPTNTHIIIYTENSAFYG